MSNETKFTKGEWLIADGSIDFVYALNSRGTNRFWLNIQAAGKDCADREEIEANAKLIKSAPNLYKSLERIMDWWYMGDGDMPADIEREAVEALISAGGNPK